jgi:hypothetical protein
MRKASCSSPELHRRSEPRGEAHSRRAQEAQDRVGNARGSARGARAPLRQGAPRRSARVLRQGPVERAGPGGAPRGEGRSPGAIRRDAEASAPIIHDQGEVPSARMAISTTLVRFRGRPSGAQRNRRPKLTRRSSGRRRSRPRARSSRRPGRWRSRPPRDERNRPRRTSTSSRAAVPKGGRRHRVVGRRAKELARHSPRSRSALRSVAHRRRTVR